MSSLMVCESVGLGVLNKVLLHDLGVCVLGDFGTGGARVGGVEESDWLSWSMG